MPNPNDTENEHQDTDTGVQDGADNQPTSGEDADLAAFEKGLEEADDGYDDAPAEDEPAADDEPTDRDGPAPDDAPADDDPAAAVVDEPAKAVEDEIAERGLKGKAADRFRELANASNEYAPVKAALEQAGLKAEDLPVMVQRARNMDEWEAMVSESTAQPEQLADAMSLIRAINSDDTDTLQAAYTKLEAELAAIGKRIGREAPGYDPLAEHTDLAEMVEMGDMSREAAQEVVKARALLASQQQRAQQGQQQQASQQQAQQAQAAAMAEIESLNAQLKQKDAAGYAQRVNAIDYAAIKQYPPEQWPARIEAAYWRVPVSQPKPAPGNVPLRPVGNRPMNRVPQNDMEAFEMGVAAAR